MSYIRRNAQRNNEQRLEVNQPKPEPKPLRAKPKASDAWISYLR